MGYNEKTPKERPDQEGKLQTIAHGPQAISGGDKNLGRERMILKKDQSFMAQNGEPTVSSPQS
jgi:hypothetical protein